MESLTSIERVAERHVCIELLTPHRLSRHMSKIDKYLIICVNIIIICLPVIVQRRREWTYQLTVYFVHLIYLINGIWLINQFIVLIWIKDSICFRIAGSSEILLHFLSYFSDPFLLPYSVSPVIRWHVFPFK